MLFRSEGEPDPECAANCPVHGVWERVTQQIIAVIDSITLQDLVDQALADRGNPMYHI